MVFPAMECKRHLDLHTDSGYRRLTGEADDQVKGYGMRGMNVMRRGTNRHTGKEAVHLLDSICKSHRLQIRSSYGAEMLAAAHGYEEAYPTVITLHELGTSPLTPGELKNIKEKGGLCITVVLTTDAESVCKSLSSADLKVPSGKTLLGHVSWLREQLQLGNLHITVV